MIWARVQLAISFLFPPPIPLSIFWIFVGIFENKFDKVS